MKIIKNKQFIFMCIMLIIFMVGCSDNKTDNSNEQIKRLEYNELSFETAIFKDVPKRLKKWIKKNKSIQQNKVFNVDGKTYVLILLGKMSAEDFNVNITEIGEILSIQNRETNKGSIDVSFNVTKLEKNSDIAKKNTYPFAIAKMSDEIETNRSFQFNRKLTDEELDGIIDDNSNKSNDINEQIDKGGSSMELFSSISPECLTKNGEIKDSQD